MPIEGVSNRVKAFYRTEVMGHNSSLNNFANWSLWYVQYFVGRETIETQNSTYTLVEKSNNGNNDSWIPSAIKTGAYFCFAVIFIIPGTIARAFSLDSKKVRDAVFAERITPPPAPTKIVPTPSNDAPLSPSGSQEPRNTEKPNPAPAPTNIVPTPKNSPTSSLPRPQETSQGEKPTALHAEVKDQTTERLPNTEANSPSSPTLPSPKLSENEHHYIKTILNQIQISILFFEELSQCKDENTLREWLNSERISPIYFSSFLFSDLLIRSLEQNPEKISTAIDCEVLSKWQKLYIASTQIISELNMNPFYKETVAASVNEDSSKKELIACVNQAIKFCREFYTRKNNAEALQFLEDYATSNHLIKTTEKESNQPTKFTLPFPFFNILTWLGWKHINSGLPADDLKLLSCFFLKAKAKLYDMDAESYLMECPDNLCPGYCALVFYYAEELMRDERTKILEPTAPATQLSETKQALPPSPPPQALADDELKKLLLEILPAMEVIIRNARLFQKYKALLINFTEQHYQSQLFIFSDFKTVCERNIYGANKSNKHQILEWLNQIKQTQFYTAPFSAQNLTNFIKISVIFEKEFSTEWIKNYKEACEALRALGQLSFIEEKNPYISNDFKNVEQKHFKDIFSSLIAFFEDFVNEKDDSKLKIWLKSQIKDRSYMYPFHKSKELEYALQKREIGLNKKHLTRWKELHPQVFQRLERLNLTEYLDEVPPHLAINTLSRAPIAQDKTG